MRTKTIKVYEYSELSEKAKEKVLTYFRENNRYELLAEHLTEYLKELLKKNKIKIIKDLILSYSLSYSQGDGLSFTGRFRWKRYYITIKRESCLYYHKNSVDITMITDSFNYAKESIQHEFKELYDKICDTVEKAGYGIIEEEQSEKYIEELIQINGYEFTEDGEIA